MEGEDVLMRKKKQKFLRDSIINQKWDPATFSQFMQNQRPDGTNIDNWTFEELIGQVELFKNLQAQKDYNSNYPHQQLMNSKIQIIPNKKSEPEIVQQNDLEENFQQQLIHGEQQNKVKIIFLKEVDKKKHTYEFKVYPDDIVIIRKLKDIYALRNSLQLEFPFYYIPPIKCVDYKRNFIQNFLDRLMDMKIVQSSDSIKWFLNEQELKKLQKNQIVDSKKQLDQVYNNFQNQSKKILYEKNEKQYDEFLTKSLGTYDKHKNNPLYFQNIFKILENYCGQNSKIFSQLKHLCYDLCDSIGEVAKKLDKISEVYKMYLKESSKVYGQIKFERNQETNKVYQLLSKGFTEWSSQLTKTKTQIIDHLAGFFHYKKREYTTFEGMLINKMENSRNTQKQVQDLLKKKEKYFTTKKVKEWDLEGFDPQEMQNIMENFAMAEKFMLPKESKQTNDSINIDEFLNKHILYEFCNFDQMSQFYIESNFQVFSQKYKEDQNKKDLLWNLFENASEIDVSILDRSQTYLLQSDLFITQNKYMLI